MNRLYRSVQILGRDLDRLGMPWALVGGLAIGALGASRFTLDVDLAVAVSDKVATKCIFELRGLGYSIKDDSIIFHEVTERISTVRLHPPDDAIAETVLDLLFGSSGIEPEIVEAAQPLEVMPGVVIPVICIGDLMAVKTLAGRPKDQMDFQWLLAKATPQDLARARRSLDLITERRSNRGKDLQAEFDRFLALGPEEP